ncbi:Glutamyl-tRNA(Gln) amidotransferase subunit A [Aromatoleum aromaticum EbN1]|uniref:Glutamyl-tRNA(Gln) amidotransferase subunit A n=1 Tax=Aromatoleum aromaticum (strain DSM 19018 / LMG 30748 / EbN1) TaxID=76114 RepID=GATA_AROAE|nr:Asp-tRNA(Asn)/Glu-tRNA(Gln) amidotransferase subunit GatA [Aromatoleum aromaticum]Q5P4D0.1 RecName: Full=Glutamyl-tRNA(Gln) amidotransferase subunit A; Short=Glu-ADT subunit A [Aromatoleum aromaticum EbN1]CAI07833.1 Glutamyl-tRNA(Gln) amidotransferase subunit A [Aromatoleum aromaticum EbN1]
MINASLTELRAALDARKISSVELATLFLDRIERLDASLNAFITVDRDGALEAARAADARIAAGDAGPLTGIPLAHKDVFCTEGVLTTCGSKMLANFVSPYDAHVVSLLKTAGAVSLGKTNMDEFAMGSSNENSHFGPAKNPWDTTRIPGGSSGGSAAAVAARLVPIATGTDTGGSVRQPAALTGVTGIKPTYGVVSRYGMIAYASSLDQGGAFGASAADCAQLLTAMAGFDPRDSTSLERPAEDYSRELAAPAAARPLAGLRIGLPKEFFGAGMADDVRAAVEAALDGYRALGATTVDVSLPNAQLAIPAYYVIAPAEASSNLSRFDGVRYGHRAAEYRDLAEMYSKSRAEGFGAEVKRRILVGTYVLSHGYYDAYYLQAQKLRRLIAQDFQAALAGCDVIAGPTSPTTAWTIGEKSDDPVQMYLSDIYTIAVNLAGLPGLSHPCGFGAGELPVGLQLVGDYFSEARLLNAAHRFQQASDWHLRRPAIAA